MRKKTIDRDALALALYGSGLCLARTGKMLGVSAPTVLRILRAANAPRRAPGRRWPKKNPQKISPAA